jgi:hypothetical protein
VLASAPSPEAAGGAVTRPDAESTLVSVPCVASVNQTAAADRSSPTLTPVGPAPRSGGRGSSLSSDTVLRFVRRATTVAPAASAQIVSTRRHRPIWRGARPRGDVPLISPIHSDPPQRPRIPQMVDRRDAQATCSEACGVPE